MQLFLELSADVLGLLLVHYQALHVLFGLNLCLFPLSHIFLQVKLLRCQISNLTIKISQILISFGECSFKFSQSNLVLLLLRTELHWSLFLEIINENLKILYFTRVILCQFLLLFELLFHQMILLLYIRLLSLLLYLLNGRFNPGFSQVNGFLCFTSIFFILSISILEHSLLWGLGVSLFISGMILPRCCLEFGLLNNGGHFVKGFLSHE